MLETLRITKRRPKGSSPRSKRAPEKKKGPGAADGLVAPSDEEVNAIFEDTIMKEFVLAGDEQKKQLLALSPAVKWQMIRSKSALHEEMPPQRVIETLQKMFHDGEPSAGFIADLVITIRSGTKTWLNSFLEAGGLDVIIHKLGEVEGKLNKGHQDLEVQSELLKCIKVSMNNPLGMEWLMENPDLVGLLALNLDSPEPSICTMVLELLTVVLVNNALGHQIVLEAMDIFKREKEESVRFLCLVNSLRSGEQPLTYKRDVMLFVNTLINSAGSLEDRILIRSDLLYAGMLEQIDVLKSAPLTDIDQGGCMSDERYELEMQIQVFEAVMLKDNTEVTRTGSTGADINLSDAEHLFKALHASVVENGCTEHFLSIMHHLLAIPLIDKEGIKLWEAIDKCVHGIVVKVDHEYTLSYSDLKGLLEAKEKLEEYARDVKMVRTQSGCFSPMSAAASEGAIITELPTPKPYENRGALMTTITARGPQLLFGGSIDESVTTPNTAPPPPPVVTPDPRAALMQMLTSRSGRATAATADMAVTTKEEVVAAAEEPALDPRANLIKMLQNKAGGGGGGASPPTDEKKEETAAAPPADPRAALLAALSKRGGGGGGGASTQTLPPSTPPSTTTTNPLSTTAPLAKTTTQLSAFTRRGGLPPGLTEPATPPDPQAPRPPPLPGMPDEEEQPPAPPSASYTIGPPVIKPRTTPLPLPPGLGEPAMSPDPDAPLPPPLPGTSEEHATSAATACGPPVIKPRTTPLPLPPGLDDPPMQLDPDAPPPPPLPGTAAPPRSNTAGGKQGDGGASLPGGKPKKASAKPPVPMKNLFWTKIPDGKIQSTVWEGLNDEKIRLDVAELEALFAKVDKKKAGAADIDKSAGKKDKPKEIHVLDGKVLQNAGIALAKYKMPPADLVKSILAMDERVIDYDGVKTLHTLAPTTEDMTALREYDGEVSMLGKVEQFYLEVMKIPNYPQRLECWIYKMKFHTQLNEMTEAMEGIGRAVEQIRGSRKLSILLEYVLALGNYLNGGTAQGGVYGVKLDVLLKLKTIKGADSKTTLLDFLIKTCEAKSPDVLDFDKDFLDVEAGTRFSFNHWRSDLGSLRNGLKMVSTQLENVKKSPPLPLDRFQDSFDHFSRAVASQLEVLQAKGEATEKKFSDTVAFFGEDPTKCSPEEFFGLFLSFGGEFARARQESEKKRLMDEKAAKRKAAQDEEQQPPSQQPHQPHQQGAGAAKGGKPRAKTPPPENLVDNILDKIKSRNADDIISTLKTGGKADTRRLLSIVRKNSDEKSPTRMISPAKSFSSKAIGGFSSLKQEDSKAGGGGGGDSPGEHGGGMKSARAAMVGTLSPKTLRMMRQQKAGATGGIAEGGGGGGDGAVDSRAPSATLRSALRMRMPSGAGPTTNNFMSSITEDDIPPGSEPRHVRKGSTSPKQPSPKHAHATDSQPEPPPPPKRLSALEKLRMASSSKKEVPSAAGDGASKK